MLNENALFIPRQPSSDQVYALMRNIAAIELVAMGEDHAKLGAVLQLPLGSRLEVCGSGFNDKTVKVRSNQKYYFVFLQDLKGSDAEPKRMAAHH